MCPLQRTLLLVLASATLLSCDRAPAPTGNPTDVVATSVPVSANALSMRIDGTPWIGDHNLFGAFHPTGYERALIIGGSHGPKDRDEQVFTLNLYGIDGPGRYEFKTGNASASVVQIANLSSERYLAGSLLGFDFVVDVRTASHTPTVIEATFSGTLTANDGSQIQISEGQFSYRE